MAFKIDQKEYEEITVREDRCYINKVGSYLVEIEAAKVIRIRKANNYETGVVEYRILEAPEGTYQKGTACNWMANVNPMYASLQRAELKNFTQQALIVKAALDEDVPSSEELNDASMVNVVFADPEDTKDASPAKGLIMRITFTEKTNREGKTFVIGTWVKVD